MVFRKLSSTGGLFLVVISLFLSSNPVLAHEKHKKPDSSGANRNAQEPAVRIQEEATEKSETPVPVRPVPLPFSGPIQEHAHNKLVHLPIGLGLAGVLFAFIALKKPEMLTAVRILWLLAALSGLGAYFTGEAQEEPFEEGALHEVVELHEKLGIGTAISLGIGFLLSLSRRLKGFTAIWAIVVLGMIMVTGYYGGLLAHS